VKTTFAVIGLTVASLTAALAATAGAGAGAAEPPRPEQVEWLVERSIEFETAEAGHGFADLEPLKAVIGEARIVGLGEFTHGTREVFQMKHRLVEWLASEMGFTIFSIEASTPEAYRLNDYVLRGEGDPVALIGGMYFWTWNTEEVLAMVEWMREFNGSGGGTIQFTGFDMQTPHVAADIVVEFFAGVDGARAGEVRAQYDRAVAARKQGGGFGVATWSFPVEDARGKRLKYTGYIKTEKLRNGWAGLWWRVDSGERTAVAFDNMMDRGPKGTTAWNRYTIEFDIPETATNINFGVLMPGDGTAWFDKLRVELDGEVYIAPDAFDFDFEAAGITGYYASNDGTYRAALDEAERYAGKQSLRLEKVEDDNAAEVKAQEAVRVTGEVLEALQASRGRYLERAPKEDVEWAIHNARIVDQCMRSRAGNAFHVRDKSMAENVAWIAGQNPDAKIVLWAHNGHITRDFNCMGHHLDRMFGDDYLPVAFAGSSGRYFAVGEGRLGDHDLQVPPEGSIESFFAAGGKPRLILDLRLAGKGEAGSGWLTEPRPFRSIGAMAMDQQFYPKIISESFDVLIYFEATAAAVQLGRQPSQEK
jgi:erythromycin esterase-like protein